MMYVYIHDVYAVHVHYMWFSVSVQSTVPGVTVSPTTDEDRVRDSCQHYHFHLLPIVLLDV